MQKHDMDLIVRSKQVVEDGFEYFSGRQLTTIFGALNFHDNNAAAIMDVRQDLLISFKAGYPLLSEVLSCIIVI